MKQEQVFNLLNDYYEYMGPIVRRYKGFIEKYIGEKFIAVFKNSKEAFRAASALQKAAQTFNSINRFETGIEMTIAMHTGSYLVGTIGENERLDSALLGDSIAIVRALDHLLLRIESPILTTASSVDAAQTKSATRHLGLFPLNHQLIDVVEVLDSADTLKLKTRETFNTAVTHLIDNKYLDALTLFSAIVKEDQTDILAGRYQAFCQKVIKENEYRIAQLHLFDVLGEQSLKQSFEEFCNTEHSSENINLWNELESLKQSKSQNEILERAKKIYSEYLDLNGKQAVNVDSATIEPIRKALQQNDELPANLFDKLQQDIEVVMTDTLKRFKQSPRVRQAFFLSSKRKTIQFTDI